MLRGYQRYETLYHLTSLSRVSFELNLKPFLHHIVIIFGLKRPGGMGGCSSKFGLEGGEMMVEEQVGAMEG